MRSGVLNARIIGSEVLKWLTLLRRHRVVGYVHNVFKSTINIILLNEELVSVTTKNIKSPIHVGIESDETLNFTNIILPRSKVLYDWVGNRLMISNIVLTLNGAEVYNNTYDEVIANLNIKERIEMLTPTIYERTVRSFIGIASIIYLRDKEVDKTILNGLKTLEIKCSSEAIQEFLFYIISHLGLGRGFTPSMDDYLLGVLSTLRILSKYVGLEVDLKSCNEYLVNNINRTTLVSGKTLMYSLRGVIPSYLEDLIVSLVKTGNVSDKLFDILSIGHNSGFYIGLGFLTALALLHSRCGLMIKALRNALLKYP